MAHPTAMGLDQVAEASPPGARDDLGQLGPKLSAGDVGIFVFNLGSAWADRWGLGRSVGWKGVRPLLPESLRGPLAYIMGKRYLKLKSKDSAMQFFQEALKDASHDAVLKRLIEMELDLLKNR